MVVDIGSRYMDAAPLHNKESVGIADAFKQIYSKGKLTYPKILMLDACTEFQKNVKLMKEHNVHLQIAARKKSYCTKYCGTI